MKDKIKEIIFLGNALYGTKVVASRYDEAADMIIQRLANGSVLWIWPLWNLNRFGAKGIRGRDAEASEKHAAVSSFAGQQISGLGFRHDFTICPYYTNRCHICPEPREDKGPVWAYFDCPGGRLYSVVRDDDGLVSQLEFNVEPFSEDDLWKMPKI